MVRRARCIKMKCRPWANRCCNWLLAALVLVLLTSSARAGGQLSRLQTQLPHLQTEADAMRQRLEDVHTKPFQWARAEYSALESGPVDIRAVSRLMSRHDSKWYLHLEHAMDTAKTVEDVAALQNSYRAASMEHRGYYPPEESIAGRWQYWLQFQNLDRLEELHRQHRNRPFAHHIAAALPARQRQRDVENNLIRQARQAQSPADVANAITHATSIHPDKEAKKNMKQLGWHAWDAWALTHPVSKLQEIARDNPADFKLAEIAKFRAADANDEELRARAAKMSLRDHEAYRAKWIEGPAHLYEEQHGVSRMKRVNRFIDLRLGRSPKPTKGLEENAQAAKSSLSRESKEAQSPSKRQPSSFLDSQLEKQETRKDAQDKSSKPPSPSFEPANRLESQDIIQATERNGVASSLARKEAEELEKQRIAEAERRRTAAKPPTTKDAQQTANRNAKMKARKKKRQEQRQQQQQQQQAKNMQADEEGKTQRPGQTDPLGPQRKLDELEGKSKPDSTVDGRQSPGSSTASSTHERALSGNAEEDGTGSPKSASRHSDEQTSDLTKGSPSTRTASREPVSALTYKEMVEGRAAWTSHEPRLWPLPTGDKHAKVPNRPDPAPQSDSQAPLDQIQDQQRNIKDFTPGDYVEAQQRAQEEKQALHQYEIEHQQRFKHP